MRIAVALFMAAFVAPGAVAQLAKGAVVALSPRQVEAAIFGIDMQGYSPTSSMEWRECIEPGGKTLYETPEGVQAGKAWVTKDGQACFAYEDTNYSQSSCYTVSRTGTGLVFDGELGGVFITTSIRPGVKSCKPADDLIG